MSGFVEDFLEEEVLDEFDDDDENDVVTKKEESSEESSADEEIEEEKEISRASSAGSKKPSPKMREKTPQKPAPTIVKAEEPKSNKPKEFVKAVQDYESTRPDELNVKTGDIIEVVQKFPDSWWEGSLHSKTGLFPSTFTEPWSSNSKSKSNDPWEMNFDSLPVEQSKPNQDEMEEEDKEEKKKEEKEKEDSQEEVFEEEQSEDEKEDDEEEEEEEEEDDEEEDESEEESEEESESESEESEEEKVEPKQIVEKPAAPKKLDAFAPFKAIAQKPLSPKKPKKIASPKLRRKISAPKKPLFLKRTTNLPVDPADAIIPKPKKPMSALGPWGEAKESGDTTRRTDPPLKKKTNIDKQYLASLTGNDIRKYRDALAAKEMEISELKKEIKVLNTVQKRQSKAIKTLDTEKGSLPLALAGFAEEVRTLKDKIRDLQAQHAYDDKMIQTQHEEILKLKEKITEMQHDMKTKNVDETSVAKKLQEKMGRKDKMLEDLARKNLVLQKTKDQEEKKLKTLLKESHADNEKMRVELARLSTLLSENGLNRYIRNDPELAKLTASPPTRRVEKPVKKNTPVTSPLQKQEPKETPSPPVKSKPEVSNSEEARASVSSKSPPLETETAAAQEVNKSTEPPAFWRKTKTKDLANPFTKLNEPAPEVVVKPGSPIRIAESTAPKVGTIEHAESPPVSTQPSKPSWYGGGPVVPPVVQTDPFKPNFGNIGLGRQRKEPWKQKEF